MKSNISIQIVTIAFGLIGFTSALHAGETKEPQDLTILRESYQNAIERAVSPVQTKYIEELKKLKVRYTKDGKLEEAIVVDKELTTMLASNKSTKKTAAPSGPDHLFGEWYCNDIETDIYIIKTNKKAFHASDTGTWTTDQTALIITWANGFSLVIDLKQTGDTVHGRSYRPGANQYELLKFDRKKGK